MKRIYHHYENWEDYKAGMYRTDIINESFFINKATLMLCDNSLFLETCIEILNNWVFSSEANLTNSECNRKAWLGQAACCYKFNVPEILTRKAWNNLCNEQQFKANKIAEIVIRHYEDKNRKIHSGLGRSLLF